MLLMVTCVKKKFEHRHSGTVQSSKARLVQKKENNEKQQWQNPRWILSDAMHERMDSILRDTQKGLDDQDRESQRYRYSSSR